MYEPIMNTEYIAFNVAEAREELNCLLSLLNGPQADELTEIGLRVSLAHAYHHINFAWNSRHTTRHQVENLQQSDFDKWRASPTDIDDWGYPGTLYL